MKQTFFNHLKNLPGWHTNKKIIIFSVDDYGNVRIDSSSARKNLNNKGLKTSTRFDKLDTLENRQDLEALNETLASVRDKNGNPAVFTAFSVPVNINFERMREENFRTYHYELLPETYEKLSQIDPEAYNGAWNLWKEGIQRQLIHPEFHGREHFNLKVFNEKLTNRNKELILSLQNRSLTSISNSGYPTISYTAAFDFDKFQENEAFREVILDGLNQFEKVFGIRARHFNPPGGRGHPIIHSYLRNGGIEYLDTPMFKKEHMGQGKYKSVFNYTGKKNKQNQIFMVRNCVFEPTHNRGVDWVNYTFKQIEAAFCLKKPAIISSHRVNFCGHIDPENRKKGLAALKTLLHKIIKTHPDVEFMTSTELGDLIRSNKKI